MDRREAVSELERAHTDDLTGAYRRGAGEAMLQEELDRRRVAGRNRLTARPKDQHACRKHVAGRHLRRVAATGAGNLPLQIG